MQSGNKICPTWNYVGKKEVLTEKRFKNRKKKKRLTHHSSRGKNVHAVFQRGRTVADRTTAEGHYFDSSTRIQSVRDKHESDVRKVPKEFFIRKYAGKFRGLLTEKKCQILLKNAKSAGRAPKNGIPKILSEDSARGEEEERKTV